MRDSDFERLVRRHTRDVYAFLLYRTGDHHVAEELVSDTLERAYRARSRYDRRRASEKTWLMTIALNRWKDLLRREGSERAALERLGERTQESTEIMTGVDDRRALLDGISALGEEEREVIALFYGADLTAKQVAALLELPVTTINGRLYRGLRRLRDLVE